MRGPLATAFSGQSVAAGAVPTSVGSSGAGSAGTGSTGSRVDRGGAGRRGVDRRRVDRRGVDSVGIEWHGIDDRGLQGDADADRHALPGADAAVTVPPCAATMAHTIERPSPLPPLALERAGSAR